MPNLEILQTNNIFKKGGAAIDFAKKILKQTSFINTVIS